MAIVRVSFFSNQLHRTVPFTAVLPNDGEAYPGQVPDFVTGKMKTLYLLHGYTGDENDYLSNSLVRELSAKYKIAVIMPAGENCFYVDSEDDVLGYGRYIGEELVEYTRRIFRLSDKREDTFIAGLSMGGYGAMRNGLVYHDTFSKICAFSGAYIIFRIIDAGGKPFTDEVSNPAMQRRLFGDFGTLKERGLDPRDLVKKLKKSGGEIPEIFMTIGDGDPLLDLNHSMRDALEKAGAPFTFIEDEGIHDWAFWNKHMEEAFAWLAGEEC